MREPLPPSRPWPPVEEPKDHGRILWARVLVCLGCMLVGYAVGAARYYDACVADKYSPATCTRTTKQIYGWSVLR
jgi:hypothetical protein